MSFWYNMYGPNPGYLSFHVHDIVSGNTIMVWNLGGTNLGRDWNYGTFGFFYDKDYTILIKGTSGDNQTAIAVDEIVFRDSQYCSITPSSAVATTLPPPTVTKPPATTTVSTKPPSPLDCTFETGLCNWQKDNSRTMQWVRVQGAFNDYAPPIDHT